MGMIEDLPNERHADMRQWLFFIVGNLDEALIDVGQVDPDSSDLTALHEFSQTIKTSEILSVLQRKFRSEQVARLGVKHIVFPILSVESTKLLIRTELEKISDFSMQNLELKLYLIYLLRT